MQKLFFLLLLFGYNQVFSQLAVGVELQAYPTGLIPSIHVAYKLTPHSEWQGRVGYNVVRHRDLGVQEDERGGGIGGSLGYHYYFQPERKGLLTGLRCDLWWNTVNWKNNIGLINETTGTTEVTVLQPTAEFGYVFSLNNGLHLLPTLSLGAEINIQTEGAEVGQGAILLVAVALTKRF